MLLSVVWLAWCCPIYWHALRFVVKFLFWDFLVGGSVNFVKFWPSICWWPLLLWLNFSVNEMTAKITAKSVLCPHDEMADSVWPDNLACLSREFLQPGEMAFSKIHYNMLGFLFRVPYSSWEVQESGSCSFCNAPGRYELGHVWFWSEGFFYMKILVISVQNAIFIW